MTRKLSALLVMCLFTACASGAWAAYYDEHSGTESDPYVISSFDDLTALSDRVNSGDEPAGAYYRLDSSLEIEGYETWNPIGSEPYAFTGHFDGGNNTITMNITNPQYRASVFGLIGTKSGYAVKNLKVSGTISGKFPAGIASVIDYGTEATIENCEFTGTLSATYHHGESDSPTDNHTSAGGIVEVIQSGTVKNCTVRNATISANKANAGVSAYAGGIAAAMGGGFVDLCIVTGTKIESFGTDSYSGGIVGDSNYGTITHNTFSGDVKSGGYSGGIAGRMKNGNNSVDDVNINSNTVRSSVNAPDIDQGNLWGAIVGYILRSAGTLDANIGNILLDGISEDVAADLIEKLKSGIGTSLPDSHVNISDNNITVTIPDRIEVDGNITHSGSCNAGFGLVLLATLFVFRKK